MARGRSARPWRLDGMTPRAPGLRRPPLGGRGRRPPHRRGRALPGQPHPAPRGRARRRPARRLRRRHARRHAPPYGAFIGGDGHAVLLLLTRAVPAPHRRRASTATRSRARRPTREALRRQSDEGRGRARDDRRPRPQRPRPRRRATAPSRRTSRRSTSTPACSTWSPASRPTHATPTDEDVVRAAFPPGSVTGAPKVQAMKTIAALEATGREVYTGAIGYLSPVAGLELNVAIRTLEVSGRPRLARRRRRHRRRLRPRGGAAGGARPRRARCSPRSARRRPTRPSGAGRRLPPLLDIPRPDPALGLLETMLAVDGDDPPPRRPPARASATTATRAELDRGGRAERARAATASRLAQRRSSRSTPAMHARSRRRCAPVLIPGGLGDRSGPTAASAGRRPDRRRRRRRPRRRPGPTSSSSRTASHVTPPADGRLLPGITRARLIEPSEPRRSAIDLDRFDAADAVYLTSAISLVTPVRGRSVRAVA